MSENSFEAVALSTKCTAYICSIFLCSRVRASCNAAIEPEMYNVVQGIPRASACTMRTVHAQHQVTLDRHTIHQLG